MRVENLNGSLIERDPPHLVRLGVLDDCLAVVVDQAPADPSMPAATSTSSHNKASNSPRRAPVTSVNQTNVPQSSSCCQAALTIFAASSGDGGSGCGAGMRGRWAASNGLTVIQPQRLAALRAPLSTA